MRDKHSFTNAALDSEDEGIDAPPLLPKLLMASCLMRECYIRSNVAVAAYAAAIWQDISLLFLSLYVYTHIYIYIYIYIYFIHIHYLSYEYIYIDR